MKKAESGVRKLTQTDVAKNMNNWRERDAELVSGVFKNLEAPGQSTCFNYKAYPGDDFQEWFFEDGEKYRIPRGVARHLNNNCYYKEYKHLPNESGQFGVREAANGKRPESATMMAMKKVNRYAFHSLEFQDDDMDMTPSNLTEVTLT